MSDDLKHIGISGMRWGHRKAESSAPSSADHNRAMANRNPFKTTVKGYSESHRRLALERRVEKIQRHGRYTDKTPAKTMSNDEIKAFMKNPVMKKTLKTVNQKEKEKAAQITLALFAAGYGALVLHEAGVDKALLKAAVNAKRARQATKFVKEGANVIGGHWN